MPAGIQLVQFHADKAPSAHLAIQKQEATGKHKAPMQGRATTQHGNAHEERAAQAKTDKAVTSSSQLPDAIKRFLPSGLTDLINGAALQGFITLFTSSLSAVEDQGDAFLARCTEYRTDIISNISTAVSERPDDRISQLRTVVGASLVPITGIWIDIVGSLQAMGPPVTSGLKGLGLNVTAGKVDEVHQSLLSAAQTVSGILTNATDTIGKLGGASGAEEELALQELDAMLDGGMATVTALKDDLVEMAAHLLAGLTAGASQQVNATVGPMQSSVNALAEKLEDSLDIVLSGTREAADAAVRGIQRSTAADLAPWLSLPVAAALVGVHVALAL